MAGGPPSTKEEVDMCLDEELGPGGHRQNQEHLVIAEMIEHGSRSLGASQRRQKLDPKAAGPAAAPSLWNMTSARPKKMGSQLPMPRLSREAGHGDAYVQECPGTFQGMRCHYERNAEADLIAEIGLEELNGLEMEVMRRQLRVITGRLRALEDQGVGLRRRDTLLFTVLVSACLAGLWLWMRR
ncbi:PREDICTED: fetal and adult testis-expressed transcript protein [Condylura cristata]|uniref:fetal and adult testis-expressed transcript protein n=1 Tax=Condylura cristata TaxID=143302 RepID=UPI0003347473|nr:PREDICTED: fetal and adult testis-expressed transcript protein [Condylura cristata]